MHKRTHIPIGKWTGRAPEKYKVMSHVLLSLMVPREGFEPSEPSLEDSVPIHWTGDYMVPARGIGPLYRQCQCRVLPLN